jgi:hypothetical protein
MKTVILTIQNIFNRHERLTTASVLVVLLTVMLGMGVISLASLNDKATKGYLLNKLESERQELVTDGEVTDMMTLYARSIINIEDSVAGRMYKADEGDITYVLPVTAVAVK